ncbi:murein hydrolase activator EnvC family protein [Candidatus Ferrigenium straubiae]|uniref:murein hydrolase activator EnvC family protein n=1 Tax=Candidatus Ferrigenium straubiae TaxID=2919506 RepID=UPI003F4AD253
MTFSVRLLLPVLCGLIFTSAACASQQEELENLRKRIAAMQREMDRTSESKSEAADALRESERAISNSNRKLAGLAEQQRAADRKLNELQERENRLTGSMAEQQALLGRLLYQQYLGGSQEYPKLLLGNRDPNQVSRDLQYYKYIARDRATRLAALRNDFAALNAVSTAVREQRAELKSLRTEEAAQKKTLEKEQQARQRILVKVSHQLRQQRREINRLQRDENRLAQLVERLTKMLAQPKSGSLFRNDNLPDSRFDGNPFDQLKGKLALPVKGEVTNRFGAPRPDSTVLWKGLFLRTSPGQAVKAIAAGRVVFADWLRGFGNLLIIDHGKGYMSLYGNNETLYKQVGDMLQGGDTVAAVGNSGGNEDSGLYFELRHESKPLDPMKWLATR